MCNNSSMYVLSNNLINLFIVHLIGDRLVGTVYKHIVMVVYLEN